MKVKMSGSRSGIFWVICSFTIDSHGQLRCDFSEPRIVCLYEEAATLSHKPSWNQTVIGQYPALKGYQWNHFPRGRVVLRNGRYTVFAHPKIIADEGLRAQISTTFGLDPLSSKELCFVADGSKHYHCVADK